MPRTGDRLAGRYELIAPIGSGGFATVFRGRDLWLRRLVAVKILLPNHAADPLVAARFGREARALAAVSHPNVVAIHDVGGGYAATGPEPYLVMDLCEDGSLADRLAATDLGLLPPDQLIPILADVAAGLAALHARGIIHRDLKPSNVLLGDGRARIADLGIALAGSSELTERDTTVGTLAYLAPEQLSGEPASPASDVHALGVVAFLGLTGALPRPAANMAELVEASRVEAPPVSRIAPGLGTRFDRPIGRALARRPDDRPTAAELGSELVAALGRPSPAIRPPVAPVASDATTVTGLVLDPRPAGSAAGRSAWLGPAILIGALAAVAFALAALTGLWPGGRARTQRVGAGRAVADADAEPDPDRHPDPDAHADPDAGPDRGADPGPDGRSGGRGDGGFGRRPVGRPGRRRPGPVPRS